LTKDSYLECIENSQNSVIKTKRSWAWWLRPVIPAFGRLRLEDHKFKASLGYIVRPYFNLTENKNKT
jgi:hypothetical protein